MVCKEGVCSGVYRGNKVWPSIELLASSSIYLAAILLANYTAMWFVPLPIFGLISVGTFMFGITFTQRDRVHHAGRGYVYTMIGVAAVMNSLEALIIGIPFRIIIASFVAIVLAELADTEIYHRYLNRPWIERVARSNAVSIPLDSILFNGIAFYGMFPIMMWVSIVFGEIVVKTVSGILSGVIWRR